LKLIFLAISSAMSLLRLSRREDWWKDAEILMLRHQLAVALRERPRAAAGLTWPDRAWLALLARTLPVDRLGRIRLIVTPATILRWHRDIVRRRWARRSRRGRSGRPPVRRDVRSVVLRLALTTGAKIYYLAGVYVYLLAAGAVAIDGWLAARAARLWGLLLATGLTTALALPFVVPVLPAADTGSTAKVNTVSAESIGWPQLVSTVRTVWTSLPRAQRAHAVIFASNYGEASAINVLGQETGLPQAVSGHNTYWWWGPGNPHATTVVAVLPGPVDDDGGGTAYLRQFFTSVRAVATLSNPYGIHNQEFGGHVYLCTGPRRPWGKMWPQLRSYS
jgi:hypothetical protein